MLHCYGDVTQHTQAVYCTIHDLQLYNIYMDEMYADYYIKIPMFSSVLCSGYNVLCDVNVFYILRRTGLGTSSSPVVFVCIFLEFRNIVFI